MSIIARILAGCKRLLYPQEPILSDFKYIHPGRVYIEAEKNFKNKHYNAAIRGFKAINSFYHTNDYTEKSYIGLTYCYIEVEQFADAIKTINQFIALYPRSNQMMEANNLQQQILEKAQALLKVKKAKADREEFWNTAGRIIALFSQSSSRRRSYPSRYHTHRYQEALQDYQEVLHYYNKMFPHEKIEEKQEKN